MHVGSCARPHMVLPTASCAYGFSGRIDKWSKVSSAVDGRSATCSLQGQGRVKGGERASAIGDSRLVMESTIMAGALARHTWRHCPN